MCFLRINTATAPLTPPGAAPTLTTVYDESHGMGPSETASPSDSLAKEPPKPRSKRKLRRKRLLGLSEKPAPLKQPEEDMKTKERHQVAASAEAEPAAWEIPEKGFERRRGTYFDSGEANGVATKGDGISDLKEERRVIVGTGLARGKRRSSIG